MVARFSRAAGLHGRRYGSVHTSPLVDTAPYRSYPGEQVFVNNLAQASRRTSTVLFWLCTAAVATGDADGSYQTRAISIPAESAYAAILRSDARHCTQYRSTNPPERSWAPHTGNSLKTSMKRQIVTCQFQNNARALANGDSRQRGIGPVTRE